MNQSIHLAVFGSNPVGVEVARYLQNAQYLFVMVDRSDDVLQAAQREGFNIQRLDYNLDSELQSLGIGKTITTIFCMLPEDSQNVFLTISARALDPNLRIVTVCHTPDATPQLLAAGANKVIDPYAVSGTRVVELLERPEVVELLEQTVFGRQDLNIAEVTIPQISWVLGRNLSEVRLHVSNNIILLGMVDLELHRELIFGAQGIDHKLDAGDILVVIGAARQISAFRELIQQQVVPA